MKCYKFFMCIILAALYTNFIYGQNSNDVNSNIGFEKEESLSQWKLYYCHSSKKDYNHTDQISWINLNVDNCNNSPYYSFIRCSSAEINNTKISPKYGSYFLQLGNNYTSYYQQKISYTFIYSNNTKILEYSYFLVMQDPGDNHDKKDKNTGSIMSSDRPYFKAYAEVNSNIYSCSEISFYADTLKFLNFLTGKNDLMYSKDWESRIIDFSRIENIKEGDSITISFIIILACLHI